MDHGYWSVGRSLYLSAKNSPNKAAVIEDQGTHLSYKELNSFANKLANYLIIKGCQKGDHIGILSGNTVEHIVALFASAKAGAISISLDPRWTATELGAAQAYIRCKFLICEDKFLSKVTDAAVRDAGWEVVPYSRRSPNEGLAALLKAVSDAEPLVPLFDEDVSTFMLTSGTTGLPKGCVRTNRVIECSFKDVQDGLDDTIEELIVVPVYYGSGRGRLMRQVYNGCTTHLMDDFDPERTADYITRHAISCIALAPTMCTRLLGLPNLDRFQFGSLKMLQKAGSPFAPEMAKDLIRKVTPNLYQAFATSETGTVTALRSHDQLWKIGSSGKPVIGVELDVVAEDGAVLPRGESGEIRVRGPQVCLGYYNNPSEQIKVFRDGWYYTGDIGRVDDDGYLYVVGRKKDMIKTGSINVSPLEIEQTIQSMQQVQDVTIVGVPDPEWGEAVMAIVVTRTGEMTDAIVAHCRRTLAPYKIPKHFQYVQAIERNSQGKVTGKFRESCIGTYVRERSVS